MTTLPNILRRLDKVEAEPTRAGPVFQTAEERADAARRYEASLYEPEEPDPAHDAYITSHSLAEIQADYEAILKGAPAPWL